MRWMNRTNPSTTIVTLLRAWQLAALAILTTAAANRLDAQTGRLPVSASVSPNAVGAPAPTATPIGGLRTRPIAAPTDVRAHVLARARPGTVLLQVPDAALQRPGIVTSSDNENEYSRGPRWIPTADAPQWRRDPRVRPVDAWRDLIVTDVVCNSNGACRQRELPVRAPWIARCGCYAFYDGWSRLWRVE